MTEFKGLKSNWNALPEGVVALFFIQMFSTLSFSVLYATLVLYMTKQLSFSITAANSVTGVFVAFNFALHLLGGYWGGRFFSNRALFSLGMFAQMIGCLLLSTLDEYLFYFGLAAFLTGCGLNVTCINCMLTQRFAPEDNRRESAFLFNYAGMNIGFFAGYSLSGYFQLSMSYKPLFLLSSLGNVVAMLLCLYYWKSLADKNTTYSRLTISQQRQSTHVGLMMVLALPLVLSQLLHFADLANRLVLMTGIIITFIAYYLAKKQSTQFAREKIYAFIVFMLVSTVFWMLFQIGPMGLTHFIENNVDREFAFFTIPPQWFQNINTLSIVIGGPLMCLVLNRLRAKGFNVNIPTQFTMALIFIGIAFCILPFGILEAGDSGMVPAGWVVLSFILQSIGELLISPIGYAMIGALAPANLQGIMMGMWMLCSGVGATLSSYSSNWMTAGLDSVEPTITNAGYSHVFLCLGLFAIASGIILFIFSKRIRQWMYDESKEVLICEQEAVAT